MTTPAVIDDKDIQVDWNHPCNAHPRVKDGKLAHVEVLPRRKKVAIVGFASSTRMSAPFNNPEYEIWGMNQLYRHIPRADRWFEMHSNYMDAVVEGTDYKGWLMTCPIPVYMVQHHPEFPNSCRFPLEKVDHMTGGYWQSTVAYMLALAIHEGFEHIALYGIDLIIGDEFGYQKPNTEMLIGYAHAKGITVEIPVQSALCKASFRYGYDPMPDDVYIKRHEMLKRRQFLLEQRQECLVRLTDLEGQLKDIEYWMNLTTIRERGGTVVLPQ